MAGQGHERHVTLVLCTARDGVLGALPPFEVAVPYWPEVRDVVDGARARFGIEATVLRLLCVVTETPPLGGPVAYLAEVGERPQHGVLDQLVPWPGDPLASHPLRAGYAEVGGPARDLAWARAALESGGRAITGPPVQVKTWNLSSVWTLPTDDGPVWLKAVPGFLAHEGPVLARLQRLGLPVPPVLAAEPGRVLLAQVPGRDQYDAPASVVADQVHLMVEIQSAVLSQVGALLADGVPADDLATLPERAERLFAAVADELDSRADDSRAADSRAGDDSRGGVERMLGELPARVKELISCGLPRTLVHGDFHPGNVRGEPGRFVVLDWGDSSVGDPARDLAHVVSGFAPAEQARTLAPAAAAWQAVAPGCDPMRAAALAAPLSSVQAALTWQGFLDRIEPDERPYHEGDPAAGLRAAARLWGG